MKKSFGWWVALLLISPLILVITKAGPVLAQTAAQTAPQATSQTTNLLPVTATLSADATDSARLATPSAEVQEKIQEKKEQDITESSETQKSKLAAFLEANPPGPLNWSNSIQYAIRSAVSQGVPANVIVLVLLFPLIASLIGASRHVIGLRGFGIYIPAVLAIALVSTGIFEGLLIFGAISLTALVSRQLLKKARMSYLPRTSLLIWMISLGLFGLLVTAPFLNLTSLMTVNIFPILILVLLSENFLDALQRTKPADAIALTIETLSLAFISSLIIQLEVVQRFAITEPELLLVGTAFINVLVGKFAGLRLTEFLRFRSIIEE